ncbi:LysR family transcriptional regulator [Betaproteobacteria bacterium]|nr:LysR family transcriptional regulator [Betaproteobacteria bacterium]GHT93732.1 LysR family transcriptional regulator [Betaproteobacteria bacterium]GHU08506.1 LysR family transcriptional regulator [Betaproteobacteria bacterium]GHU16034.1 LysR family transcriptional regulator [Betaproteobacteria bacterium]
MAKLDWFIRANLKLRHLQLLVALDELRSVGRVAGYLNVSQPAVSKTLSMLESGLEVTLFQRTTRGMEPTEHGTCLIRYARTILGQLSSARSELRDISEGRISRISMGVLPSAAAVLMPNFIARLEKESLATSLVVHEGTTIATLLPELRAGDIDLIVGNLPQRSLGVEFETELLYEDPLVVVAGRHHPLAGVLDLQWNMLMDYPMLLPPEGTFTRELIDNLMMEHHVTPPRRHVESISILINLGVLQATPSIGFLSRELLRHFSMQGTLVELPLVLPNVAMHVGLAWRTDKGETGAHQLVRRLFYDTCNAILARQKGARTTTHD